MNKRRNKLWFVYWWTPLIWFGTLILIEAAIFLFVDSALAFRSARDHGAAPSFATTTYTYAETGYAAPWAWAKWPLLLLTVELQ